MVRERFHLIGFRVGSIGPGDDTVAIHLHHTGGGELFSLQARQALVLVEGGEASSRMHGETSVTMTLQPSTAVLNGVRTTEYKLTVHRMLSACTYSMSVNDGHDLQRALKLGAEGK